jgi:hypothetical protein
VLGHVSLQRNMKLDGNVGIPPSCSPNDFSVTVNALRVACHEKAHVTPGQRSVFILERVKTHLVCLEYQEQCDVFANGRRERAGESPMTSSKEKAAEFRRQATLCREVAERMSLEEDRARMIEMAEHWLELAKRAETETEQSSSN